MTEKSYRLCLKDPGDDGAQRLAGIIVDRIDSHECYTSGYLFLWLCALISVVLNLQTETTSSADSIVLITWAVMTCIYAYIWTRHHRGVAFDLRCALMSIENDPENLAAMMQAKFARARPMGRLEAWLWDKQYLHSWLFVPMRLLIPGDVLLSRMSVHSEIRYKDAMAAIDKLGTEGSEVQTHWHRYRCNEARARVMESHRRLGRSSTQSP